MRTMFNRFAIIPIMCHGCHNYIWLEKYRRGNYWVDIPGRLMIRNLCKECIKKHK